MNKNFKNTIEKGLKYPALFLAFLAAIGLISIVGIIVSSVVMRKLLSTPLFFSEEIVGLLMSVSLFLALPMITFLGNHIEVTIFSSYLEKRNPHAQKLITILANLMGVIFCSWLFFKAIPWLEFAVRFNLKTETSRILLYPGMAILPISVALTGLIFLTRLLGWLDEPQIEKQIIPMPPKEGQS